jgi:hypothetical protein
MTGKVIEFPSGAARDWTALERSIREVLSSFGATAEQADWIVKDIRPRWERLTARFQVSTAAPAECTPHLEAQAQIFVAEIERLIPSALEEILAVYITCSIDFRSGPRSA